MQACHFSGIVPEITGISIWLPVYRHLWQFCRQLRKNTSRLHILKCTPITITQDVLYLEYTPSFYCVILVWGYLPGWRLSTFYWTLSVYSRPFTAEWVVNWDTCAANYRPFKQRLEVNVKDWSFWNQWVIFRNKTYT